MSNETTIKFTDFNLRPELIKALEKKGFESPMPVQIKVLEDESVVDTDLIVQARTGSGKTLGFALPLINVMDFSRREPQIVVLSPTRELAQQTAREFAWLGAECGVKVATLVGGLDMERQIRTLRGGANIIVGTPGRILDHIRRGTFKAESVSSIVLDEGDHMLDMGFRDEMEEILGAMPHSERTWLFSATMPDEVLSLSKRYLDAPKEISLVNDVTLHEDITQKAYIIPSRRRFEGLTNVLIWEDPARALVFCGTKAETQDIADKLCDNGFKATAIHGDMSQRERNSSLNALRGGRAKILVATDVAARGLDIDAVSHVIQYGLPQNLESFVHRSGRTGRGGHEGSNMILLTAREKGRFRHMVRNAGSHMKMDWYPAPDASEIEGQSKIRFEKITLDHALESDEYTEWAKAIYEREDATMMIAGLLAKAYGDQPSGYSIRNDVEFEMNREKDRKSSRNDSNGFSGKSDGRGGVAVQFDSGKKAGVQVGPLLGLLCRCIGIGRQEIGNIKLRDNSTTVELSKQAGELFEARKGRLEKEGLEVISVNPISGFTYSSHGNGGGRRRNDRNDRRRSNDGRSSHKSRGDRDRKSGSRNDSRSRRKRY